MYKHFPLGVVGRGCFRSGEDFFYGFWNSSQRATCGCCNVLFFSFQTPLLGLYFQLLKIILIHELPVSQSEHRCKGPSYHVRSQGHIKAGWLLSKASFSYVSSFEKPNCLFLLNGLSHGLEWICRFVFYLHKFQYKHTKVHLFVFLTVGSFRLDFHDFYGPTFLLDIILLYLHSEERELLWFFL